MVGFLVRPASLVVRFPETVNEYINKNIEAIGSEN
jgi:hypothetical protein